MFKILPHYYQDSDFENEVVGVADHDLDLYCDVSGDPDPSVLWLKDGRLLSPLTGKVILNENNR